MWGISRIDWCAVVASIDVKQPWRTSECALTQRWHSDSRLFFASVRRRPRLLGMSVQDSDTLDDGRRALLTEMIADDPERLRRRSISLGVPRDEADDVAQTALLRAWRSIEHLHAPEPGQMCAWLDTIARNATIDLARQRSRRPASELDDDMASMESVAGEVEMRVILDNALRALHELPENLREPLLLSAVEQLSAPQIAERLTITPATARQRIARARKALATCRVSGMSDSDVSESAVRAGHAG